MFAAQTNAVCSASGTHPDQHFSHLCMPHSAFAYTCGCGFRDHSEIGLTISTKFLWTKSEMSQGHMSHESTSPTTNQVSPSTLYLLLTPHIDWSETADSLHPTFIWAGGGDQMCGLEVPKINFCF